MTANQPSTPVRHLSVVDAICVIVGIVVGAGIFKAPSLVAMFTGSGGMMLLTWLAGGLLCLCGALCYAELATAYPNVGGEYVYLSRSFGGAVGFLFVWARATVIQTGSIAALAYVFGDYIARLAGWQHPAPMLLALLATVVLTGCNMIGLRAGKWTQNVLTAAKVVGVLAIVIVGLWVAQPAAPSTAPAATAPASAWPSFDALGLAMVFVLYTFGGWNESAYVAGELRRERRNMLWVLLGSIGVITVLYLAVNLAYLRALGIDGMAGSQAVAADAMHRALGSGGSIAVTILVAVSALGALDGCIFTGSRAICALGGDYAVFRPLGKWHGRFRTPANAIGVQSAIAAVLILLPGLGGGLREALGSGFDTAVEYTAPAFWAFFLLTGIGLFVLRVRDRGVERPFRVPLFPLTPIVFCLMSAWMLYRSLDYRLGGAMVGLCVLLAGVPVYLLCRLHRPAA
jgi:APA family basic amino acid/polyamine antiporter